MILVIDMKTMMQSADKMERGWSELNGWERMMIKKSVFIGAIRVIRVPSIAEGKPETLK